MTKENILKALDICGNADECCECPYRGLDGCDRILYNDAKDLIKGNSEADPTYSEVIIMSKRDSLEKWFSVNGYRFMEGANMEYSKRYQDADKLYNQKREIFLKIQIRFDNGKRICRIKCPINPLPIRGEFECVSVMELLEFLESLGWHYKNKANIRMFK